MSLVGNWGVMECETMFWVKGSWRFDRKQWLHLQGSRSKRMKELRSIKTCGTIKRLEVNLTCSYVTQTIYTPDMRGPSLLWPYGGSPSMCAVGCAWYRYRPATQCRQPAVSVVLTSASECCKELWGLPHCWWPWWPWPRSGVRTESPSPPASSQVSYFNKYLDYHYRL